MERASYHWKLLKHLRHSPPNIQQFGPLLALENGGPTTVSTRRASEQPHVRNECCCSFGNSDQSPGYLVVVLLKMGRMERILKQIIGDHAAEIHVEITTKHQKGLEDQKVRGKLPSAVDAHSMEAHFSAECCTVRRKTEAMQSRYRRKGPEIP
jgi:hypothetical protein